MAGGNQTYTYHSSEDETNRRLNRGAVFGFYTAACSSAKYVANQAGGQLRVLHGRERIEQVLKRSELPSAKKRKLELVLLARRWAHEELGLRETAAYTYYYDTGGRPLAYNLSGCPKTSLRPKRWTFPIVGRVPYLGFFQLDEARLMQQQLEERENLDTELRPIAAFSSLGWFADPIFSPMLDDEDSRLVEVVIHETTHTTIFLRGRMAFNESLATFIGNEGALQFLNYFYGAGSGAVREFKQRVADSYLFSKLVSATYDELERLYQSSQSAATKLARREEIFAAAQQSYKKIFPDQRWWGSFVNRRLNNAILLNYGRYQQGLEFHRRVYEALDRDLGRFVELYKRSQYFDDPLKYVRRQAGLNTSLGKQEE